MGADNSVRAGSGDSKDDLGVQHLQLPRPPGPGLPRLQQLRSKVCLRRSIPEPQICVSGESLTIFQFYLARQRNPKE